MKLNNHELLIYMDDNYRENVLKSDIGMESIQHILDEVADE